MNDVFESLKETIRDRLSSPLIGPYVIAFIACNFKALLFVLSGLPPQEKIAAIDALYSHDNALFVAFLLPLAIALFYVFLFPFPARFIMRYTLHQNRLNRDIQHRVLEETVLTLEESRDLIARHKAQLAELEGDAAKAQQQAERLKAALVGKDQEIAELKSALASSDLKISALTGENAKYVEQIEEMRAAIQSVERMKADIDKAFAEEEEHLLHAGINRHIVHGQSVGPYMVEGPDGKSAYDMFRSNDDHSRLLDRVNRLKPLIEQVQTALGNLQKVKNSSLKQ
ncbi:hypothetical protein [Ectopseudomonas mendocina]|uniref:hypothetical protein n=1 Tax=Ectopseudomonas mendocina TaxID=300 RepID=UPI00376F4310